MTQDDDLRDVIGLRIQLTQEVLDLAEEHREEVWKRVSSRIKSLAPETDPEVMAPAERVAPRRNGPERRRLLSPPRHAPFADPQREARWYAKVLIYVAGAALVAGAVAAAIALT